MKPQILDLPGEIYDFDDTNLLTKQSIPHLLKEVTFFKLTSRIEAAFFGNFTCMDIGNWSNIRAFRDSCADILVQVPFALYLLSRS